MGMIGNYPTLGVITPDQLQLSSLVANAIAFLDGNKKLTSSSALAFNGTALTLSANPTLSGGTANGVAYLNGSKVLTTGSALTFDGTNVALSGALTIGGASLSAGNKLLVRSGLSDKAIGVDNGSNSGFVVQFASGLTSIGNDFNAPLAFLQNNSEQMRLTSTGLGIGTSSPLAKLAVAGNAIFSGVAPFIAFAPNQGGSSPGYISYTNSTNLMDILSTGDIAFETGGITTPKMRLDVSGNLGLGVTLSAWNSAYKVLNFAWASLSSENVNQGGMRLNVNAYADSSGYNNWYRAQNAAATSYKQNDGVHSWYTAAYGTAGSAISFTQAMTLDASGRLGVGATNLEAKLHVEAAGSTPNLRLSSATKSSVNIVAARDGFGYWPLDLDADGIRFLTNNTECARIDSSGNLLVGTTSASTTSGTGLKVYPGTNPYMILVGSSSINGDNGYHMYSTGAGAFRFYVSYGGQIYATSTSISAISDATLKENVRDLETGLNEVMALRPRRFDWKNGDAQNVAGFVAQEVEQVLPELVTDYVYNKDEEGNDIIKKSLKMGDILPTLVKAIQEQQAIIEQLKADVAALKG